jgi:hypothetical protein
VSTVWTPLARWSKSLVACREFLKWQAEQMSTATNQGSSAVPDSLKAPAGKRYPMTAPNAANFGHPLSGMVANSSARATCFRSLAPGERRVHDDEHEPVETLVREEVGDHDDLSCSGEPGSPGLLQFDSVHLARHELQADVGQGTGSGGRSQNPLAFDHGDQGDQGDLLVDDPQVGSLAGYCGASNGLLGPGVLAIMEANELLRSETRKASCSGSRQPVFRQTLGGGARPRSRAAGPGRPQAVRPRRGLLPSRKFR